MNIRYINYFVIMEHFNQEVYLGPPWLNQFKDQAVTWTANGKNFTLPMVGGAQSTRFEINESSVAFFIQSKPMVRNIKEHDEYGLIFLRSINRHPASISSLTPESF
ncbi:hypothetical protein BGZ58_008469 [Dissophora ornata]|nr:hypothetical protein BGZ58_008469 [Dissophora ornata]